MASPEPGLPDVGTTGGGASRRPTVGRRRRRPFRNRSTLAGLLLVGALGAVAAAAPALAPHDPALPHPEHRLEGPGPRFPLGTDELGRCQLSRLLVGARTSLGAPVAAIALILLVGIGLGGLAGFAGGIVDGILMRLVDVLLAFPALIPAVAIVGVLGPGVDHLLIAVAGVWWASYARIVRGMVISERRRPYVLAARALGLGRARILIRHILPNVVPPVLVLASVEMGTVILTITALGFLGLGVQPPAPEWGAMLADGADFLLTAPQLALYPGLAISLAVIAFNLVGEGLRDLLDPRLRAGRP